MKKVYFTKTLKIEVLELALELINKREEWDSTPCSNGSCSFIEDAANSVMNMGALYREDEEAFDDLDSRIYKWWIDQMPCETLHFDLTLMESFRGGTWWFNSDETEARKVIINRTIKSLQS